MAQINHTNRAKIERRLVRIQLTKHFEPWRFELSLTLDEFNFAGNEHVVVEATHGIVTERFPFGTVDAPYPNGSTDLVQLTGRPNIYFRVKVIASDGSGLILAEADRVPITGAADTSAQRMAILKYDESELRPLPWWMDWSNPAIPALVINPKVSNSTVLAKSDLFRGLNASTVVEEVLTRLCFVSEVEDLDDEDEDRTWESLWLRFIKQFSGEDFDPSESSVQDKTDWITRSVDLFASGFRPIAKLNRGLKD